MEEINAIDKAIGDLNNYASGLGINIDFNDHTDIAIDRNGNKDVFVSFVNIPDGIFHKMFTIVDSHILSENRYIEYNNRIVAVKLSHLLKFKTSFF